MKEPLLVKELLASEQSYSIPLYQRNFSWSFEDIAQLIIDILDSIKSERKEYYIGTLVVSDKDGVNSIIDGQQRFTSLLLIGLAIKNIYADELDQLYIQSVNLPFDARKHSDNNLNAILNGEIPDSNDEISHGYKNTILAIKDYVTNDSEYDSISISNFYEYLFNQVKIFINRMPKDLDLNLYFERFNSRGEQLEFHEIIKAELMQKLFLEGADSVTTSQFAKIWDACSEFNTPVILFFKKNLRKRI